jgi:hypothetical protein
MKRMALFLVLIVPLSTSADGWADLQGKSHDGAKVGISPSNLTDDDYVWSNGSGIPKPGMLAKYDVFVTMGEAYKTYERQQCDFDERNGTRLLFSCSRIGQSSLAGTTYKIIPNPKDNCDYQAKFVCIKGCGKASTPKVLIQRWWECGDL